MNSIVEKQGSFRDSRQDPGLLVAKGRFIPQAEEERSRLFRERDQLLRDGHPGHSLEVIELTRQIDALDKEIDHTRREMERDHVKSLASAIFMAMSRCGYANVRAVGRNANYNAVKSIAIATGYCRDKEIDVCFEVVFDEGNLGALRKQNHVQSVTAMMYKLKGYKDWKVEDNNANSIDGRTDEDSAGGSS